MDASPLRTVSVVVAAYNATDTINATLDSVTQQSHRDLELIVVDDGSTDGTAAVVGAAASRDARIRLVSQPNAGVSRARNHGARLATGDWITFVDADDLWHEDKLVRQIDAARGREVIVLTGIRRFATASEGVQWLATSSPPSPPPEHVLQHLLTMPTQTMSVFTTSLIPRHVFLDVGGWNEDLGTAEDWDCWLRCARRCPFVAVDDALYFYRKHEKSVTVTQTVEWVLTQHLKILKHQQRLGGVSEHQLRQGVVARYLEGAGHYIYGKRYGRAAALLARSLRYPEAWGDRQTYMRGLELMRGLCGWS